MNTKQKYMMIVCRDKHHSIVEPNTFLGTATKKGVPRFLTKQEWGKVKMFSDIDCIVCHCITNEKYGSHKYRESFICCIEDLWITETNDDGSEIMLKQKEKYERFNNIKESINRL